MKNLTTITIAAIVITMAAAACKKDGAKNQEISPEYSSISIQTPAEGQILIHEGDTIYVNADVKPLKADELIAWESSDPDVAAVGMLNAACTKAAVIGKSLGDRISGEAMLTATTMSGRSASARVVVIPAVIEPTKIYLDMQALSIKEEEAFELNVLTEPENATFNSSDVEWSISGNAVCMDQEEGERAYFSGAETGIAAVKAKLGELEASCNVTVVAATVPVASVSISGIKNVTVGDHITLTADVQPYNASNRNIEWTVTNGERKVLTITSKDWHKISFDVGHHGNAVVKVTTKDGGKEASVTITSSLPAEPEGAVDLGYRVNSKIVYWDKCNIGAKMESSFGDYFAWGDPDPHYESLNPVIWDGMHPDGYTRQNCKWMYKGLNALLHYNYNPKYGPVDYRYWLEPYDDPAVRHKGDGWHMPDIAALLWLKDNCTWTETERNGVKGMLATSKVPGFGDKAIFFPANGYFSGTDNIANGSWEDHEGEAYYAGTYWCRNLDVEEPLNAYNMTLAKGKVVVHSVSRYIGEGVRAILRQE